jgi:PAS domain S-box-containing protein
MNILNTWHNASLKNKLLIASISTICLILFFASAILLTSEVISLRNSLKNDLMSYSKTTAANVGAALAFQDRASAMETLEALKPIPTIIGVAIYDAQGRIFVRYSHDANVPIPEKITWYGYHSGLYHFDFSDTIILDGEIIGSVYICAELASFYSRMLRYALTLVIIMGLAFILSYILFTKLHQIITKPLFALTDIMHTVSKEQDYSIRAQVHEKDELGYLAHGFNEMLEKIHERDTELALYRTRLEELVEKRTTELTVTNRELEKELTERFRVEKELLESEHRYRTIFETTGNPSVIIGADMTILMVNSAFERISGHRREEVEGKMNWTSFIAADDIERLKEYHQTRRIDPQSVPTEYECHVIDKAGNILNVLITSASIPGTDRSISSMLDMTERKRLEEQLIQSQKMEAIGQLAGGVAHDFNNILTSIIGYGNLIQMKIPDNDKLTQYMNPLLASADKAKHLTQALLAFSRKQIISPKPVDLNEIIENVKTFLVRLIGEDIEVTTHFLKKDLVVFADTGQIDQVLMNFATNARDAMPDGGTFSIETDVVTIGETFFKKHHYGKPGQYALIRVSDTGVGISKKIMEHIFEPFFTTKEVGKGTGLGLSIVYGIVKQNNGYINAYSEPGHGTVFKIYLPLIESRVEPEKTLAFAKPCGGNEVILLAEDDIQTRAIIKEVLKEYGYTVIEAVDGEEAVNKYHAFHKEIALIVVDVIMPKKNGKAVYEEIKKTYPDTQALFISGYTAEIIHKKGIVEENIHFLEKPIIANMLLAKVRTILDNN